MGQSLRKEARMRIKINYEKLFERLVDVVIHWRLWMQLTDCVFTSVTSILQSWFFTLDFLACVSYVSSQACFICVSCYIGTWMECKSFIGLNLSLILCMAFARKSISSAPSRFFRSLHFGSFPILWDWNRLCFLCYILVSFSRTLGSRKRENGPDRIPRSSPISVNLLA